MNDIVKNKFGEYRRTPSPACLESKYSNVDYTQYRRRASPACLQSKYYGVLKVTWECDTEDNSQFYELTQGKLDWSKIVEILEEMKARVDILDKMPTGKTGRNLKADIAEHYFGLDINYPVDNEDPCKTLKKH